MKTISSQSASRAETIVIDSEAGRRNLGSLQPKQNRLLP